MQVGEVLRTVGARVETQVRSVEVAEQGVRGQVTTADYLKVDSSSADGAATIGTRGTVTSAGESLW